jgi:beta-glucanase (GH16 family)
MSRAALFACLMWLCPACGDSAQTSVSSGPPDPWTLVWSDEFDGETVNSEHWSYSIGTGAEEGLAQWGNGELQSYTDAPENCSVSEGVLRITALKTGDEPASYTSARLHTRETHLMERGRFEIRVKLPAGQGLWPALWLLGNDRPEETWPDAGEIDIFELVGQRPDRIAGSLHGPGYSGGGAISSTVTLDEGTFADDFHVIALEWDASRIAWFVDGESFAVQTHGQMGTRPWVFNHEFYLILNLAIGGHYPGPPDETTAFPAVMEVDYIRVFTRSP